MLHSTHQLLLRDALISIGGKISLRQASTKAKSYLPSSPVRTRFAPSPTGYLHLGSLRTALFNYLLAKRTGGQFILRIEDTDQKRTVAGAEERLCDDLKWAGLQWDEGPIVGGPCGPYRQSERTHMYQSHADELISKGHAYRCFCPPQELHAKALERAKLGLTGEYDRKCFHIPAEESHVRAKNGDSFVVRLKDPDEQPTWHDIVHGVMGREKAAKQRQLDRFDDSVLLKSDGLPTYHLANVVDDHYMNITHVIRGVEWIISTRKHVTLYKAFGWETPAFAHVGLLLDQSGSKLSKRDGTYDLAALKQSILPEALNNFLALLGWSHSQKDEYFSMEALAQQFDLRLNKSNPTVNLSKLWYLMPRHAKARVEADGPQYEHLLNKVCETIKRTFNQIELATVGLSKADDDGLRHYTDRILRANINNYTTAEKFVADRSYFFTNSDSSSVERIMPPAISDVVVHQKSSLWSEDVIRQRVLDVFNAPNVEWPSGKSTLYPAGLYGVIDGVSSTYQEVEPNLDESKSKRLARTLVNFYLRAWITWGKDGPSMADTMTILGKSIVMQRIRDGRVTWKN